MSITEGEKNEIPEWLIIRILMRTKYEFYTDNHGYVTNIFDLPEESLTANNFLLSELLGCLAKRRKKLTNFKIEGYYYVPDIINHMIKLGYLKEDILWALELLLNRGLIIADHQRSKGINELDYVKISASGFYHIRFLSSRAEYLSNTAIDTFFNEEEIAKSISYYHKDYKTHRLNRIKLLKDYLTREELRLDDSLPEFKASKEAVCDLIESIEKTIEFSF